MILDTSAVVAIVFREEGYEDPAGKLARAEQVGIGSPTLVESGIVITARFKKDARGVLARFLSENGVRIVPFSEGHFSLAMEAWMRYGKGRHSARLNFGDCLSFATAKMARTALLCVGEDFRKTDILIA